MITISRAELIIELAPALMVCRLLELGEIDVEKVKKLAKPGTDSIINLACSDKERKGITKCLGCCPKRLEE